MKRKYKLCKRCGARIYPDYVAKHGWKAYYDFFWLAMVYIFDCWRCGKTKSTLIDEELINKLTN